VFAHDIRAAGVAFATPPASAGPSTARCYVLVTPDGERTMNTYLGAAQDLHPNDIDPDAIAAAQIIYLEGYLWDPPHAKEAFLKAAKIAHDADRDVALTLSDAFCVDRYRAEFLDLIRAGTVDLVFANERELHSLYETADFDTALDALRKDARLAVITRSERGCLIVTREETDAVPASPVERVVDATGAGDLFAAGFLVGLSRGAGAGGVGGRRSDQTSRRPTRDVAQGLGAGQRLRLLKAAKRARLEPAPGWRSPGVILELLNSGSDPARRVRETGLFVHSDSQKFVTVAVLSRNRRGVLTLVPEKFPAVVLLSGGYSWVPLQTVSPAGFQSARGTWSRAAAAGRAVFASVCDIWSFRMAATSNCRSTWRIGRARAAGAALRAARFENNFGDRETGWRPRR